MAQKKFICNSRARRFGKSVTADMLVAYFSKGADSRELFALLNCEKNKLFVENMNQYDTIFMDIQAQFVTAAAIGTDPSQYISKSVVRELKEAYPEWIQEEMVLNTALGIINHETGNQFVIIFDEWDYPVRELGLESKERSAYIDFLRVLFKSSDAMSYIRLAYLTGILPMVRAKGQFAVNNFHEYTMIRPKDLGEFTGFTEDEVQALCKRFGMDFMETSSWYDGYRFKKISAYL